MLCLSFSGLGLCVYDVGFNTLLECEDTGIAILAPNGGYGYDRLVLQPKPLETARPAELFPSIRFFVCLSAAPRRPRD